MSYHYSAIPQFREFLTAPRIQLMHGLGSHKGNETYTLRWTHRRRLPYSIIRLIRTNKININEFCNLSNRGKEDRNDMLSCVTGRIYTDAVLELDKIIVIGLLKRKAYKATGECKNFEVHITVLCLNIWEF